MQAWGGGRCSNWYGPSVCQGGQPGLQFPSDRDPSVASSPVDISLWLLHMVLGPSWEWVFWVGKIQGHSTLCQDLC